MPLYATVLGRRGSNVSLTLDMCTPGCSEQGFGYIMSPREESAQEYLQTASNVLTAEELHRKALDSFTLQTEFFVSISALQFWMLKIIALPHFLVKVWAIVFFLSIYPAWLKSGISGPFLFMAIGFSESLTLNRSFQQFVQSLTYTNSSEVTVIACKTSSFCLWWMSQMTVSI